MVSASPIDFGRFRAQCVALPRPKKTAAAGMIVGDFMCPLRPRGPVQALVQAKPLCITANNPPLMSALRVNFDRSTMSAKCPLLVRSLPNRCATSVEEGVNEACLAPGTSEIEEPRSGGTHFGALPRHWCSGSRVVSFPARY